MYFNEIIKIENLSDQKDIHAQFKVKYLDLNQNVADFSNVLISRWAELDKAFDKSEKIADDLKRKYGSEKKVLINEEFQDIQNEYNLYIEWLATTIKNTATILNDLSLASIKFESKINEELKLKEKIPPPAPVTNFPMPERLKTKTRKVQEKKIEKLEPIEPQPEEKDLWVEIEQSDRKEDKKKSQNLYKEGNKNLEKKNYDKALNDYTEAVKYDKNNFRAVAGISKVYIKIKKYDNAINMINKAIEIFKKNKQNGYTVYLEGGPSGKQ